MRTSKDTAADKKQPTMLFRWVSLAILVASTVLALCLPAFAKTKYVITDGDSVIVCMSNSTDPQAVIEEAGLTLGESDTYTTQASNGISEIHINRVQMISVEENGQFYVVGSYGGTVSDVLTSLGITLSDSDVLSCGLDTETYDGMTIEITRVVLETEEYDEVIEHGTRIFEDSSLPAGEEEVLVEGVDGLNHFTAQITYENGVETQRTILTQQLVRAAQDEVILQGMDRSVMEQTFSHTDGYEIPTESYTYTPPLTNSDSTEHKTVPGCSLTYHAAVQFTATAYTCNSPNYQGNGKTYTGTDARLGVVAVDPDVIPLGTRMYIASADGEYIYGYCVAEDTGELIQGNIVDLYYDTHEQCVEFGRRDVIIYFLD